METENKKLLVEKLMGWELVKTRNGGYSIVDIDVITPYFSLAKWNPDTNPAQFKDVWNKLDSEQRKRAEEIYLNFPEMVYANHADSGVDIVLNNLPKVCQAVVDVVKKIR